MRLPRARSSGPARGSLADVNIGMVWIEVPDRGRLSLRRDDSDRDGVDRDDLNRALFEAWKSSQADGVRSLGAQLGRGVEWSEWWIDYIAARMERIT